MQVEVLQFVWDWYNQYGVPTPTNITYQLSFSNYPCLTSLAKNRIKYYKLNNYETFIKYPGFHNIYFDKIDKHPLKNEIVHAYYDYIDTYGMRKGNIPRYVVWLSETFFNYIKDNFNGVVFYTRRAKINRLLYCDWKRDPEGGWTFAMKSRAPIMEKIGILKHGWKCVPRPYKVTKFYCREFFTPGGWDLRWWY